MRWPHVFALGLVAGGGLAGLLVATPARASLPELKLSPLEYTQHLELGHSKVGALEASNPTSTSMHVSVEVQAFRQVDNRGALEYYDDARVAAGIVPALRSFELGPREAVRFKFTVDPNALGPGGTYAVIFLRVSSGEDAASQINTSARVGSLLILDVGGDGTKSGRISQLSAPSFIFGTPSAAGIYHYANTGSGSRALAYAPTLRYQLGWGSRSASLNGPFVFPGRDREATFKFSTGNTVGIVPLTLSDTATGQHVDHWIIMITGFWCWLLPVLLGVSAVTGGLWLKRRRTT